MMQIITGHKNRSKNLNKDYHKMINYDINI